jgi:hypothetical protein
MGMDFCYTILLVNCSLLCFLLLGGDPPPGLQNRAGARDFILRGGRPRVSTFVRSPSNHQSSPPQLLGPSSLPNDDNNSDGDGQPISLSLVSTFHSIATLRNISQQAEDPKMAEQKLEHLIDSSTVVRLAPSKLAAKLVLNQSRASGAGDDRYQLLSSISLADLPKWATLDVSLNSSTFHLIDLKH